MRKKIIAPAFIVYLIVVIMSCNEPQTEKAADFSKGSYGYDAVFLKKHLHNINELNNSDGAKVLVTADYQGRVMTSTADGDSGNSFGWINYDLIATGKFKKQFNPVGGEERFWVGPEGGQYSLYFKQGDSFNISNWQVPPLIDTIAYTITRADSSSINYNQKGVLVNYSGTSFQTEINRSIHLLDKAALSERLKTAVPGGLKCVAYETNNSVKNTGDKPWKKETGLVSIWLLGMFTPSDETVAFIPYSPVPDAKKFITDNYFGQIPPERLVIKDSVLMLKCDGKMRGKLGLAPAIAKSIAASFDFKRNVLTVILFDVDKNGDYVNSKWEMQKEPYKGDAVNAYNDGPLKDGGQLGPFYEIESSSAARELNPGEEQTYKQVTAHFEGDYSILQELVQQLFGVKLDEIKMH